MNVIKKYQNTLKLSFILLVVFGMLAFSHQRYQNKQIQDISIEIDYTEELLITQSLVNKLLIEKILQTNKIAADAVDLNEIENYFNQHPMFLHSNVYKTIDGKLNVHLKQKKPLARYHSAQKRFYMAEDGKPMPLSEVQSARVPLVIGDLKSVEMSDFLKLLTLINADEFLKKNITGIQIKSKNNLVLNNRVYDFDVIFGSLSNIEKKLSNYKAFLLKTHNEAQIYEYKTINLIYKNQVVCTK